MRGGLLLDAVADLARLMGEHALRYFRTSLDVEIKADGSEVTRADRECERLAADWIRKHFPGDTILGEEFGVVSGTGARRWLIDPIDGTRGFVRGVPLWGSMVGVEEADRCVAGAISCAAVGDLVAAEDGHGCWHNGSRVSVSTVASIERAVIVATDARFAGHPARRARWAELSTRVEMARTWGDCFGYVLVATGRAEMMVDNRLSPWDAAPLGPIIGEAGGVITDWRGHDGIGEDAIATNAALAGTLRQHLGVPEGVT